VLLVLMMIMRDSHSLLNVVLLFYVHGGEQKIVVVVMMAHYYNIGLVSLVLPCLGCSFFTCMHFFIFHHNDCMLLSTLCLRWWPFPI
jgi:hypothetical protein